MNRVILGVSGFLAVILAVSAPAGAGVPTPLTTIRVASGLDRPVFATHAPAEFGRLFIVEQAGVIKILDLTSNTVLGAAFLNISSLVGSGGLEQGLLGLAFHPDYVNNGFFYVNYTNNSGNTVIARYTVLGDPGTSNVADAGSAQSVMTFAQPFANHNGGWIDFGPNDGFLYIATGDGGDGCDPGQRAQDLGMLLGKMLRVDVNGDDFPADAVANYAIPVSNPFVGVPNVREEIWAYGLRNPWRDSFDRLTGDLYIADVGQVQWEEIDFQAASSGGGENYGWDCMEGSQCSTVSSCLTSGCTCGAGGLLDPIWEYDHNAGCSITGGYVYRGCAIPDLAGTYFFGDFCNGRIWSFGYDGVAVTGFQERTAELAPGGPLSIGSISSFGEDAFGELYIVEWAFGAGGEVFKIVPATPGPAFDCNANGREDACDVLSGSSPDANSNGRPDDCAKIVSAASALDHGGTELFLDLLVSNVEPRVSGVRKLVLGLDEPVNAVLASVSCVNNVFGGVVTTAASGTEVVVDLSAPLANEDCCTFRLTGDMQDAVQVRPLRGDISRDGAVTTGDASIIRFWFNGDPAVAGAEFDLDDNGLITTGDFSQVRFDFNKTAPVCP
ncbi:MAG: PQQ-dependent sugar dehydrogenase [Phycisphaerae bacterium]